VDSQLVSKKDVRDHMTEIPISFGPLGYRSMPVLFMYTSLFTKMVASQEKNIHTKIYNKRERKHE